MRKTAIYSVIFSVISLVLIFYMMKNQVFAVSSDSVVSTGDVVTEETEDPEEMTEKAPVTRIMFQQDPKQAYLGIPLEFGFSADRITVENHYMDRQLWIGLKGVSAQTYADKKLTGNTLHVLEGYYEETGGTLWLKMRLDGIYEVKSILENGFLYMNFLSPREVYSRIAVIDAPYEESAVVADVVTKIQELAKNQDVKIYYTTATADGQDQRVEERVSLANEVKADMLISLRTGMDKDSTVYGTCAYYNDTYFIPAFGSIELADIVERDVVTAISGKALGLTFDSKDPILTGATVPAMVLQIGYLSNAQEKKLMERNDYQTKIATGILQAINDAYEIIPQ
ncbi:MAG: N-acetylmuramoyl-L-alanine amidase [Lachnospiraceae bacterium]|nr:N-acetylmuramoyl-L-alanine amidase [Lachnospiraceae bacterium]